MIDIIDIISHNLPRYKIVPSMPIYSFLPLGITTYFVEANIRAAFVIGRSTIIELLSKGQMGA